jgi:hypothetical protein
LPLHPIHHFCFDSESNQLHYPFRKCRNIDQRLDYSNANMQMEIQILFIHKTQLSFPICWNSQIPMLVQSVYIKQLMVQCTASHPYFAGTINTMKTDVGF